MPDIVVENTEVKILIENKITKHRKLELSQLTVYPEDLKKIRDTEHKKIMLIFLVPKGYEYLDKIEKAKKKYSFISITYWEDLVEKIKRKNDHLKSEILTESITFFETILNSIPEINFSLEEMKIMTNLNSLAVESAAIGKTLDLFYNVIDQLKNELIKNGVKSYFTKREQPTKVISEDCLGYYFCKDNCFLGYSFGLMGERSTKEYVVSFAIHEDIVSKIKLKKIPANSFYFDGDAWYYFKINKNWLEKEAKENELLQYCEKVMKDIAK
jgi:hypothetical protein